MEKVEYIDWLEDSQDVKKARNLLFDVVVSTDGNAEYQILGKKVDPTDYEILLTYFNGCVKNNNIIGVAEILNSYAESSIFTAKDIYSVQHNLNNKENILRRAGKVIEAKELADSIIENYYGIKNR